MNLVPAFTRAGQWAGVGDSSLQAGQPHMVLISQAWLSPHGLWFWSRFPNFPKLEFPAPGQVKKGPQCGGSGPGLCPASGLLFFPETLGLGAWRSCLCTPSHGKLKTHRCVQAA